MGRALPPRIIKAGPLIATAPRTGNLNDNSAFRINNLLLRGFRDSYRYWESFSGLGDLSENVPMVALTGTLAIDATSSTVTGTGTIFTQECHLGQFICAIPSDNSASYLLVIQQVIDDATMIVWGLPAGSATGLVGWRMPVIFAVNNQRGTALRGNALKIDRGSFIGVGDGTLRINGQVLPGESMTLSRQPKIAVYNPTLNTYEVDDLGLQEATAPTLAAVGGGTKGMQGASYSIVVSEARKETVGFGNPSTRADVTIATNDQVACTFAPLVTPGANARIVWVTTFADSLGADLNYLNGPWRRLRLIDDTEVPAAGGTINLEWLDAEVEFNQLVSFNNDAPTDAEFVELLNAIPVWVSCQGQGNVLNPAATSPGPFIVPAKPGNIEAAPLELAFSSSPPETILGALAAEGRIYLPTTNKLQIAQSTPSDVVPILIRPFWSDGFANPYQINYVDGTLYAYTVGGPTRSVGSGDVIDTQRNWAADVYEITRHWNPGQTLCRYDPFNDAMIYFHAADRLNASGFWTTKWLAYGISVDQWLGGGELTADDKDQIVSGVATVADRLEIIVSGRRS